MRDGVLGVVSSGHGGPAPSLKEKPQPPLDHPQGHQAPSVASHVFVSRRGSRPGPPKAPRPIRSKSPLRQEMWLSFGTLSGTRPHQQRQVFVRKRSLRQGTCLRQPLRRNLTLHQELDVKDIYVTKWLFRSLIEVHIWADDGR